MKDEMGKLIIQQTQMKALLSKILKESKQLSNYAAFWSFSDTLHFELEQFMKEKT